MLLFLPNGNLQPGITELTLEEIKQSFGYNARRALQVDYMERAVRDLASCGCTEIFLDGSFVTKKPEPDDYDACWNHVGVDLPKLKIEHPVFFDFDNKRANQKHMYLGEFFIKDMVIDQARNLNSLRFFQLDREDNPKGIIKLLF